MGYHVRTLQGYMANTLRQRMEKVHDDIEVLLDELDINGQDESEVRAYLDEARDTLLNALTVYGEDEPTDRANEAAERAANGALQEADLADIEA